MRKAHVLRQLRPLACKHFLLGPRSSSARLNSTAMYRHPLCIVFLIGIFWEHLDARVLMFRCWHQLAPKLETDLHDSSHNLIPQLKFMTSLFPRCCVGHVGQSVSCHVDSLPDVTTRSWLSPVFVMCYLVYQKFPVVLPAAATIVSPGLCWTHRYTHIAHLWHLSLGAPRWCLVTCATVGTRVGTEMCAMYDLVSCENR